MTHHVFWYKVNDYLYYIDIKISNHVIKYISKFHGDANFQPTRKIWLYLIVSMTDLIISMISNTNIYWTGSH